ncbi:MAG: VCBS repeat-containing protein [Planctomycetota bacterium]
MLTASLAALALAQFSDARPITHSLESHDAVHSADVDGDGAPDIVVASRTDPNFRLAWLRQLPNGSFALPERIDVGDASIRSIDSADLNGDAVTDLVVVDGFTGSTVLLLLGLGGGAFEDAREIALLNRSSLDVTIADVDSDGDLDLLVPSLSTTLVGDFNEALITNLGGGTFAPQIPIAEGPLDGLLPFDADGDFDLDLVAYEDEELITLRNDGAAGFVRVGVIDTFEDGGRTRFADLDGDGRRDLVVVQESPLPILTYRSTGGFGFQPTGSIVISGTRRAGIGILDVDRDGADDLVVAPPGGQSVLWLAGTPGATLSGPFELTPGQRSRATDLALADFDGDGGLDLLLSRTGASLAVLDSDLNASGPAFETTLREITGRLEDIDDVVALDVDGDGDRDVIGASNGAGLVLARSIAFEDFATPVPFAPSIDGARRAVRADVDGDGLEDVLVEDREGRFYALWNEPSADLSVALIDGVNLDLANEAAVGDLEGDGDLDVFVPLESGVVEVYEQTAPRVFAPRRAAAASPDFIREVVAVDADADGDLDLVALEERMLQFGPRSFLRLFEGAPGGSFVDRGSISSTGAIAEDLGVLQVRADIRPSFVWTVPVENAIDVARPFPANAWTRIPSRLPVNGTPQRLVVEDIDGVGSPDLVVRTATNVSGVRDSVESILVSDAGSFFARSPISDRVTLDADMEVVDLDGDMDADVVFLDPRQGRITWYANGTLGEVGEPYCGPAVANSSGRSARLIGAGDDAIDQNELTLFARDVPVGSTGLFLVSNAQDLVPMAGGSTGTLCLGGAIGRYVGPGAVQAAGIDGLLSLSVDLTSFPSPTGPVTPMPGSLWFFQTWYRDAVGGVPTSNFTNGLSVALQ